MLNALSAVSLATFMAAAPDPSSAARPATALPPIGVSVIVGRGISPSLVTRILAETDAIWRPGGFTFVWQREGGLATALRVTIDGERQAPVDGQTPLGWIHFDERSVPEPEIHLSYANATDYLQLSVGVVGIMSKMPTAERELLLGRAMGRALAHEMGHYLLASKAHTKAGLMQTQRSASDLFGNDRRRFQIDEIQQSAVAARLSQQPAVTASNRPARSGRRH
jgi:hypothetical protein